MDSIELWRGPECLSTSEKVPSAFSIGWQVMRLALWSEPPRILEARSIYADLGSHQSAAILRAVFWHSRLPGYASATAPIFARFIELPTAKVVEWITTFDGIAVAPQRTYDKATPERSLRIVWESPRWESHASTFEVSWQGGDIERSPFSTVWQTTWHEMGEALCTYPQQLALEEDWRLDLERLDDPPYTTTLTSTTTGYQLDVYPPVEQQVNPLPHRETPEGN